MPSTKQKPPWNRKNQGWATAERETYVYHLSQLVAGAWTILPGGCLRCVKTGYADDVNRGFWLGIDTDGEAKFNLGGTYATRGTGEIIRYLKWSGTQLELSGSLRAGDGTVYIDENGVEIQVENSYTDKNAIRWAVLHGEPYTHRIYALLTVGRSDLVQSVEALASKDSYWRALAYAASSQKAVCSLSAIDSAANSTTFAIRRSVADGSQVQITGYGGAKVALYGSLVVSDVDDDELATEGTAAVRQGFYAGSTTNYTKIDNAGHQTMVGNGRPWRDELGELLGKKRKGSRITEDLDEGALLFADTCAIADDWVIANVQLNHDKDLSASIYPHLHWHQASSNVPNWLLQYRWQVQGAAKTTAWTSAKYASHAATYSSGTLNQITKWAAIAPPSGAGLSDIVQFRLLRDCANDSELFGDKDPLTGNASAVMFDVHFRVNSIGSDSEYAK